MTEQRRDDEITQPIGVPDRPKPRPITAAERIKLFGSFTFTPAPTPDNPDRVEIERSWVARNIMPVQIAQLAGRRAQVHRLIAPQFLRLWEAWERAGLLDRVVTFNGAWSPRFKRRHPHTSAVNLSNHAWGTAFDINAPQNPLGREPAQLGQPGCVRELVPLALEHGFFWGGHFGVPDGMHFEVFRVP